MMDRALSGSNFSWMAGSYRSQRLLISFLLSSSALTASFRFASSFRKQLPTSSSSLSRRLTPYSLLVSKDYSMSKRKDDDDQGSSPPAKKRATKKPVESNSSSSSAVILPCVPDGFQPSRARLLTTNRDLPSCGECVVYWMSRDQRVEDNHAMLYARGCAAAHNVPLKVMFNLVPTFLEATLRQYDFMIEGLQQVETGLRLKHIPFHLTMGDPVDNVPAFAQQHKALMVVCDFSPLRIGQMWHGRVAAKMDTLAPQPVPYVQVDAHNIVPCWVASPKCEYSARTIRGKINGLVPEYLVPFPNDGQVTPNDVTSKIGAAVMTGCAAIDWRGVLAGLTIDRTVGPVSWLTPGSAAGLQMLEHFLEHKLKGYAEKRNDPNQDLASNLSPYLHFGQVSAQRCVLTAKAYRKHPSSTDSFVEEVVVRRELADNFCFYNPNYDSLEGCYDWAKDSLQLHSTDPRPHIYSLEQMENAQTRDDLWNAAQLQMVSIGKMHGFLRMYWAKKILEWSPSPAEALRRAIFLNDRYELDGRDPNGYVGCMWSIGGIHDQGWGERAVFGKIRYMNYEGCKRKFDVKAFVNKYPPAAANAAAFGSAAKANFFSPAKK